eukprot:TRINITY_DN6298_c0_g1_i1.p4 TRINITY_DN6298_c0_g1~~TRINITY_DN6298_c0_g1_i1.p4  ORF type:complete len:203 (+),score=77.89 TRINITY_DN6298_c0_g1_i1:610-1218(+)
MHDSRDPNVMLGELYQAFQAYGTIKRVFPPSETGGAGAMFATFVAKIVFASVQGAVRALDGVRRTAPHLAARFAHADEAYYSTRPEAPAAATDAERQEEARSRKAAGYNQLGFFNAYAVLGVPRGAPRAAVMKAFKSKAMQHHPDKNVGDEGAATDAFQLVQKAKHVLTDADELAALQRQIAHAERVHGGARVNALFPKAAP